MKLANDICRCCGQVEDEVCKERETCARYLNCDFGGLWTPVSYMLCRNGIYDSKIEGVKA